MDTQPTVVDDILVPPLELMVPLQFLKTSAGAPVTVKVRRIEGSRLKAARHAGWLGGAAPPSATSATGDAPNTLDEQADALAKQRRQMEPLVAECSVLTTREGEEVQPAFFFSADAPRHARSVDGRALNDDDFWLLASAMLTVLGYVGASATLAEETFRANDRGAVDGGRTVEGERPGSAEPVVGGA